MNPETLASHQERILTVLMHIQQHLNADLGRDRLAQVANLSPCHFSRIFKHLVGEGLREHVRRLRLEQAAARLRFSREDVLSVALDAGFESHEAFTRAFSASFGLPPSGYRKIRSGRVHLKMDNRMHPESGQDPACPRRAPLQEADAPVCVEDQPPRRVAFVREVGPYREAGERAWRRLFAWAVPLGIVQEGTELIGRSHDDPEVTPPDRTRYDAAVPIPAGMKPSRGIGIQNLPSGRYARLRYVGPMEGEAKGWYRLLSWTADNGHRVDFSTSYKIYRKPVLPEPPAEMISDLYILLEEKPWQPHSHEQSIPARGAQERRSEWHPTHP